MEFMSYEQVQKWHGVALSGAILEQFADEHFSPVLLSKKVAKVITHGSNGSEGPSVGVIGSGALGEQFLNGIVLRHVVAGIKLLRFHNLAAKCSLFLNLLLETVIRQMIVEKCVFHCEHGLRE